MNAVPDRIHVDGAICQGHGRCYDLVPGLFTSDADGNGVVRDDALASADPRSAQLAVDSCPEAAISIGPGFEPS